ncbi:MAG TPA: NADH-quinone oxidoreductase subunit NuoG, partial [Rhodocyclaceae bacterium]|nr:NADH-quinone oxidoreductase subunit NuoG [Rhodocyclaceae bacterium]
MSAATATIDIDGRRYEVAEGANLLAAALGAGLDLPYFCWHPALGSVGACRQCAVKQYKDDDDTDGRIAMACMTPVADGARFSIDDPEARRFRQGVVEMLMANHPHDCPVCEEGGECHLQDVTVMTGQVLRRYRGPKRTHRNQDLGPFLNHEMNRCIACYRCVRFYRDYAGGRDLDAFASREQVYFGRAADGALESPFAGNLAEVCPTGVFTDGTFSAHYARKWDLECAPSICVHCALGCNTSPGARDGTLRRIVNRYHGEVNGYFLCDRGRFGYDFANHAALLRAPRLREAGGTRTLSADEVLALLAGWLGDTRRAIGIGSPRASLESNFALRALVGAEAFHCGLAGPAQRLVERCLARLREGPPTPTLREVETADAALVLGEDPTASAPRLALALRQAACAPGRAAAAALDIPAWHDAAVREAGFGAPHALHLASPAATELDDVTATRWHGAPDQLARLALAVAHAIDPAAPPPPDADAALAEHAGRVAAAL